MDSEKVPFHEAVAEKLIQQLKQGTAPWQKPWTPGEAGGHMPINPTTGKRYKGINALHLMSEGRDDQRWMTYKQAAALDAQVRKGEKGTRIQYWKFDDNRIRTDTAGKPVLDPTGAPIIEVVRLERPRVFYATVFNAEQVDGLPPPLSRHEQTWNAVERAEQILLSSGAFIVHGEGDRAFYRPTTDSIHLPEKRQFASADGYYAVALHELGHWSGHESRLDRDLAHPFGSEGYAKEELRAEIASMILGDELGIGYSPDQHAAYVGSWIKALQEDPLEIFRAAAEAEKIREYVMGLELKHIQDQSASTSMEPIPASDEDVMNLRVDPAEKWVLSRIEHGTLPRAADSASVAQLDRIQAVLVAAAPLLADNPFWQRHHFPDDVESMQERIAAARKIVEQRKVDAPVAAARLAMLTGNEDDRLRAVDPEHFLRLSEQVLGFALPPDWNGRVRVQGYGSEIVDGEEVLTTILPKGSKAQAWGVFAQHINDNFAMMASFSNELDANLLAERLSVIAAHSTVNEFEKAARLSRINEERVRRDPNSTEEQIAAARETRKDAEFKVTINDEDLQRRLEESERGHSTAHRGDPDAKISLAVPYKQKDEAKALGAKWDRNDQCWYVPAGGDPTPFSKWVRATAVPGASQPRHATVNEDSTRSEGTRQYLAVPFSERAVAKAAGAEWDRLAKSWFAGSKADMTLLGRWKPENVIVQQDPAMTPREEFSEVLKSVGCLVNGEHPIMNGTRQRIMVLGEKHTKNSGSGFYVAHLDGHPAGYVKNNKTGVELTWKSKGYVLPPEQKASLLAEAALKMEQRNAELSRRHEQAAERVTTQLEKLAQVTRRTAYMQAKGIDPHVGALTDNEGKKTYLPAFDADGKQWSMQYIQEDGTKRFAKDSRKEGCFHVVGGIEGLAKSPVLVIAEGYATAAQLKQSLGFPTVCAFDSGNLPIVAQALHQKFPKKPVMIAGDDDRHLELTQGCNPGRTKAEEAAKLVGGTALFPIFAPNENRYPADLEGITPASYREHQKTGSTLSDQQLTALNHMRQFTDFNDLAHNSAIGARGLAHQVCSAADDIIARHSVTHRKSNMKYHTRAEDIILEKGGNLFRRGL
jgi:putative DNA primase/helicase